MTNPLRAGRASVAVLVAVGLAACGETVIDEGKAEDAVAADVERNLDVKVKSVDCPPDFEVEAGKTFECRVTTADGDQAIATLKILNDDADVAFVDLKATK